MQDSKQLLADYPLKELKVLQPGEQLAAVRFSPDGKMLAAGTFTGQVRRWEVVADDFKPLPELTGHGGWVQGLAFHPDGKRFFTGDSWGQLRAWSHPDGKPQWNIAQAHDGWIRKLVVSPDGKWMATCGRDRKIRVCSPDTGVKGPEWENDQDVLSLAFSPDGKSLISGDLRGAVKQWDAQDGKLQRTFDAKVMHFFERLQDVGGVRCFAFDAKGETLAVGGAQPKSGGFVTGQPLVLIFDWKTGALKDKATLGMDNEVYVTELLGHSANFFLGVTSGQPGQGKIVYLRPGDAQAFFSKPLANCHCLTLNPAGNRLVVSSTNANSSGNGAVTDKDKKYLGNSSPLHVFAFGKGG